MRKTIVYTEEKIQELIKKGRGQGEGKDYIPWVQVGEFGSDGRCTRGPGIKTKRTHHLFSDLEEQYFYILEWSDSIIDIREQYPLLPVSNTANIANRLGVKHPKCVGTKYNHVMTTDFLITVKDNESIRFEARSVKYASDLNKKRVIEKLNIEKSYWAERNIPLKSVTENSFPKIKAKNIDKLLGYYDNQFADLFSIEFQSNVSIELINELIRRDTSLRNITKELDFRFDLPTGSSLSLFYHLAAHKVIPVNMDLKISPTKSVTELVNIKELSSKSILKGDTNIETQTLLPY